jgi:hypothetical protein
MVHCSFSIIPLLDLYGTIVVLQGVHSCTKRGESDERQYYLAPSARALVTQNAVKAQVSYQWNGI